MKYLGTIILLIYFLILEQHNKCRYEGKYIRIIYVKGYVNTYYTLLVFLS